jgi:NitT/TauT family transport system permease protein
MKNWLPVLIVLTVLILLCYPLALLFGLPLARRDMADIRKWQKETITAQAPLDVSNSSQLPFASVPENAVLVQDGQLLEVPFSKQENMIVLESPLDNLVTWGETLEDASGRYYSAYSFGEAISEVDAERILYAGEKLLIEGSSLPRELPDGTRRTFTFNSEVNVVLVDNTAYVNAANISTPEDTTVFEQDGQQVTLNSAPAFGSHVRALTGDYAVLDADAGFIATAAPFQEIRAATSVIRLAETLQGEVNGENRKFTFARENIVETDKERAVFAREQKLSDTAERPSERVDGTQITFTFPSDRGLVVLEGKLLEEGTDYTRIGNAVTFNTPPARNAELRNYPDYYLSNAANGEILLAVAPPTGSRVWASQYTIYSQPACGKNMLECFYALPQHPVPFPHWIAQRLPGFFTKFPLNDERNVIRAVLYTSLGTLSALALGGLVGILLALIFVLFRPLERALLPWTIASQTIPIIALVPVMLLVLGNFGITVQTSFLPTAIIGAYICFFPVVVSTVKGLRSVDPLILDLMRSYAASPLEVFRKIRFPAAVPFFFTGLKLGTAAALVGALVAETESNNRRGLGFQILGQVQTGNVADVWILLLISALLGVGLVSLVGLLQRVIAPWEKR